jgi:hypothetical protein
MTIRDSGISRDRFAGRASLLRSLQSAAAQCVPANEFAAARNPLLICRFGSKA